MGSVGHLRRIYPGSTQESGGGGWGGVGRKSLKQALSSNRFKKQKLGLNNRTNNGRLK